MAMPDPLVKLTDGSSVATDRSGNVGSKEEGTAHQRLGMEDGTAGSKRLQRHGHWKGFGSHEQQCHSGGISKETWRDSSS